METGPRMYCPLCNPEKGGYTVVEGIVKLDMYCTNGLCYDHSLEVLIRLNKLEAQKEKEQ